MQSSKFLVAMACSVGMVAVTPIGFGDGPCEKGFRDSTPAERGTMTAVLQVAKKALPPAPTGWVIVGDDQISVTTSICRDYEGAPWSYHFNRNYQRVDDQDARNKIIADAAAASIAALKQKQPRLDAAMAKVNEIVKKQVALVEKGDMAGAQALNDDIAKAQADYQKIMEEGDSQAQMDASLAKASRDMNMYIDLLVNANQEVPDATATPIPLPQGARGAFRWSTTREHNPEDHALILVGPWQSTAEGQWRRVRHGDMAPTAAQTMSIHMTADPDRLTATLGSIDVKSLAAVLPK